MHNERSRGKRERGLAMPGLKLLYKGVTYDVGINFVPNTLSRPGWDEQIAGKELHAIHHDLHCNAVNIYGSDAERLIASARVALALGLHVWLQPRLIDGTTDETLAFVVEVARRAEELRQQWRGLTLIVGGELSLTATGIVPGASLDARVAHVMRHVVPALQDDLNALLHRLSAATRAVLGGEICYASGSWEAVNWQLFDIVAVNLYRDERNRDSYRTRIRRLQAWGKPVAITEFGCCSYQGAERAGGLAHDVVDWETVPPTLRHELVRDEQVQADELHDLLRIYSEEGVQAAFVFTFIEPTNPYAVEARFDLDRASYGLVRVYPPESGCPPGYWEPKVAFHTIAALYRA